MDKVTYWEIRSKDKPRHKEQGKQMKRGTTMRIPKEIKEKLRGEKSKKKKNSGWAALVGRW